MYKLLITELAHKDLDNIVSYIAVQLASPHAAKGFLDEVAACYGFLKNNPKLYELCKIYGWEKKATVKRWLKITCSSIKLMKRPKWSASCAFFTAHRIIQS